MIWIQIRAIAALRGNFNPLRAEEVWLNTRATHDKAGSGAIRSGVLGIFTSYVLVGP